MTRHLVPSHVPQLPWMSGLAPETVSWIRGVGIGSDADLAEYFDGASEVTDLALQLSWSSAERDALVNAWHQAQLRARRVRAEVAQNSAEGASQTAPPKQGGAPNRQTGRVVPPTREQGWGCPEL